MSRAKISIKGRQFYGTDGDDSIELITDGNFEAAEGGYKISYDETEMTGMEGVRTTISVTKDNMVTLERSGLMASTMVFEQGKRSQCHYSVGAEHIMMTVDSSKVVNKLGIKGGSLFVDYSLEVMGEHMSDNNFFIKVENGGMTNA